MEDDDDDNPVVKEIPVFLSQSLAGSLAIVEFPVSSKDLLLVNKNKVIQCQVKEEPLGIMLELESNINSSNYCKSKGEQMAINVDGRDICNKNPEEVTFPSGTMDRHRYTTRALVEQNCAVGVLHDNELHLTPVEDFLLLRPSFKYLDKSDKLAKSEAKDLAEDGSGEEEEEAKQVTVKFARQETERSKKARQKSFSYVSKQNSKEVWLQANYHERGSDRAQMESSNLYCSKPGDKVNDDNMSTEAMVAELARIEGTDTSNCQGHGMSLGRLRTLPLADKIKKLLSNARLLHFSQITSYLGGTPAEVQDYLKVVQQVAVLVQGCWVVQSELLYARDTVPAAVPATLMRCARDFILYLFTKHKTVTRRKILDVMRLPGETIKELLLEVASLIPASKEWQFKLAPDTEFIKLYPEVVQRQYIKWEMKHDQLVETLKNPDANVNTSPPGRHRRKSHRDSSFSSDNEGNSDTRRNGYQIAPPKMRRIKKNSVSFSSDVMVNGDS